MVYLLRFFRHLGFRHLGFRYLGKGASICLLVIGFASAGLAMSAGPEVREATPETALARVEGFNLALLDTLKIEQHVAREQRIRPEIRELFDVGRISTISLGRTWRSLDQDQRSTFVELLTTLIVATYADRFDGFSGQQFVTDEVIAVKSGFVVRTRLTRPNNEDVSLHYFVRDGRIFNVVADGVSDLSLRRADYNSIIKNEGYTALLAHIENKIALARSE